MSSLSELQEPTQYPLSDAETCQACGNSPTNHIVTYIASTFDIWQGMLAYRLSRYRFFTRFERALRRLSLSLDRLNYSLWHTLGIIRFGTDSSRAKTYRSQVVWEEAIQRGIPMQQLRFLGTETDIYRAHLGRWVYFESLPIPHELPQTAFQWIDDKFLLYRLLRAAGIPIPETESVTDENAARHALRSCGGPVVVKPRAGSRGRHTTTHVATEEDVGKAFRCARELCRYVLVSRHLKGSVCRGTLVAGKLVGFFQADPARVRGDGVSTIRELGEEKNASKHVRVHDVVLNAGHADFLSRFGHDFDSVLEKGKTIDLSHWTGRILGGETWELLDTVHPALRRSLEKAAAVLGVPVVGFDLIIEDPEKDPATQEWGIIEANSLPFIDLHDLPLHGTPSNVAAHVWDLWGEGGTR